MIKRLPSIFSRINVISFAFLIKVICISSLFLIGTGAIFFGLMGIISATSSESITCEDNFLIEDYSRSNSDCSCISWATLTIDISGAVMNPGIYQLSTNSRVADVVEKAGGLSKDADPLYVQNKLNLAQRVADGEKIIIPFINENKDEGVVIVEEKKVGDESNKNLISINDSSLSELQELPGIGQVRAEKIMAGRPYTSTYQLVEKKIISENSLKEIGALISL